MPSLKHLDREYINLGLGATPIRLGDVDEGYLAEYGMGFDGLGDSVLGGRLEPAERARELVEIDKKILAQAAQAVIKHTKDRGGAEIFGQCLGKAEKGTPGMRFHLNRLTLDEWRQFYRECVSEKTFLLLRSIIYLLSNTCF